MNCRKFSVHHYPCKPIQSLRLLLQYPNCCLGEICLAIIGNSNGSRSKNKAISLYISKCTGQKTYSYFTFSYSKHFYTMRETASIIKKTPVTRKTRTNLVKLMVNKNLKEFLNKNKGSYLSDSEDLDADMEDVCNDNEVPDSTCISEVEDEGEDEIEDLLSSNLEPDTFDQIEEGKNTTHIGILHKIGKLTFFFYISTEISDVPSSLQAQDQQRSDGNDFINRDVKVPSNMFNRMETYSIRFLKLCEECSISSNSHRALVDFVNELLSDSTLSTYLF